MINRHTDACTSHNGEQVKVSTASLVLIIFNGLYHLSCSPLPQLPQTKTKMPPFHKQMRSYSLVLHVLEASEDVSLIYRGWTEILLSFGTTLIQCSPNKVTLFTCRSQCPNVITHREGANESHDFRVRSRFTTTYNRLLQAIK